MVKNNISIQFIFSVMSDSATPSIAACQASLSITNSRSLLKLMSIKSVMPSSHLILCHPLLLLPPILPSIRVFTLDLSIYVKFFAKLLRVITHRIILTIKLIIKCLAQSLSWE